MGADNSPPTSYLNLEQLHNSFEVVNKPRPIPLYGTSKGRSIDGWCSSSQSKGGDGVGKGIGRSGRIPDGGVLDGSGWEVDGVLVMILVVVVRESEVVVMTMGRVVMVEVMVWQEVWQSLPQAKMV
ncbi:hypothetical protein Tco_0073956 [Tanacetum coccineum]